MALLDSEFGTEARRSSCVGATRVASANSFETFDRSARPAFKIEVEPIQTTWLVYAAWTLALLALIGLGGSMGTHIGGIAGVWGFTVRNKDDDTPPGPIR